VSRTRVPRWTPPLSQALRMSLRPAIAYAIFMSGGLAAFVGTILWYEHNDLLLLFVAAGAAMVGMVIGLFVSVLRARVAPVMIALWMIGASLVWVIGSGLGGGSLAAQAIVVLFFFFFALGCGLLALQHRWELFASFWPACGWIGAAIFILNKEGQASVWAENKVSAWLPVPLAFLACFLVLWLLYLAAKQAMRVDLWQSLSGAAGRRVSMKQAAVGALPRRNLLPMLVVAALLFGIVAILSPYLWRTGRGDHKGDRGAPRKEEPERQPRQGPKIDGEGILQELKRMGKAAKDTAVSLWPLLFLVLLYRPAKRALLKTHLLTPVFPTPPTERIDNNWEYVRIAAEDAGVVPHASDSVEQLLAKMREQGLGGPGLAGAAEIYARTRYGFTVARGDAIAMRGKAVLAAKELRVRVTGWQRIKNWWRPLS